VTEPSLSALAKTGAVLIHPQRRSSLLLRLVGAIVIVALAPQILVVAWSLVDRRLPAHLHKQAQDGAETAAALLSRTPGELPEDDLRRAARDGKVWLRVFEPDGKLLFNLYADNPRTMLDRWEAFFLGDRDTPSLADVDEALGPVPERIEVLEARKRGSYVSCQSPRGGPELCEAIVVVSAPNVPGSRLVYVDASSERAVSAVLGLRHQLLRLGLLTAPVALVLALYTGRRLVRPLERLRQQALANAAAQSPSAVFDPERSDEIGVLADAFNVLLTALEKKRTDNEAFVADLAHEFKNPVAAIRVCADTLLSGPLDQERATRLARVLRDSTGKLDQLVTHFLELARAEAGMPNEERSQIDVTALTRALVDRMPDDARYAALRFAFEGEQPAIVVGVPHRLDALFRELLDNGASFAGEAVRLSVTALDSEVRVTVQDDGPGISSEDLPRVFSRFFTRRERQQRGTGLGLALVRAVAEAHGGTVMAESRPGEGARFEVRLPRA